MTYRALACTFTAFFAVFTLLTATAPAFAGPDFLDVQCMTEECAGQRAGYAWAKQNAVTDAEACEDHDDASEDFISGCEAFIDENTAPEDE